MSAERSSQVKVYSHIFGKHSDRYFNWHAILDEVRDGPGPIRGAACGWLSPHSPRCFGRLWPDCPVGGQPRGSVSPAGGGPLVREQLVPGVRGGFSRPTGPGWPLTRNARPGRSLSLDRRAADAGWLRWMARQRLDRPRGGSATAGGGGSRGSGGAAGDGRADHSPAESPPPSGVRTPAKSPARVKHIRDSVNRRRTKPLIRRRPRGASRARFHPGKGWLLAMVEASSEPRTFKPIEVAGNTSTT